MSGTGSGGEARAQPSAVAPVLLLAAVLALLLAPGMRAGAEPLSPERVVEEIRWKDAYTVEEVKRLVYAVAAMYRDDLDRAVREATRPLEFELESLRGAPGAGVPQGELAAGIDREAREGAGRRGESPRPVRGSGVPARAERPTSADRQLRVWRVVGISAIAVGLLEAAVLLSR